MKGGNTYAIMDGVFRLAVFGIFYTVIAFLNLLIIACAIAAVVCLVNLMFFCNGGNVSAGALAVTVALTLFAVVSIVCLIKPWITFRRNVKPDQVEVTRSDCPKLFDILERLSKETKTPMPRHVYLGVGANACAAFNTTPWRVLFPTMDYLMIGIGMFKSMKVDEVTAVLAYEFGHNGMRTLTAIEIAYGKIDDLMNSHDGIDRFIEKWRGASFMPWRLLCVFACLLANWTRRFICQFFPFVIQGFNRISREKKFSADTAACRCTGSKAFISSICKIQHFQQCLENQMLIASLDDIRSDGKIPENYFTAYDMVVSGLREKGWRTIYVADTLTEVRYPFCKVESRIKVKDTNVLNAYPDLQERIDRALSLSIPCGVEETESAWTLIPDEIAKKVSDRFFERFVAGTGQNLETIPDAELKERVETTLVKRVFPGEISEFFDRCFERFDMETAFETSVQGNPFTDEYRHEIAELNMARADMTTLTLFRDGKANVSTLSYNGVKYRRKKTPIEVHQKYLDDLVASVSAKDSSVCSYLCHVGNETDCNYVRGLYESMAKLEGICDEIDSRFKGHDEYISKCFASGKRIKGKAYKNLCARIAEVEKVLQAGILAVKESMPGVIEQNERGQQLMAYTTDQHNCEFEFSQRSFTVLQHHRRVFSEMCTNYHRYCRLCLANMAHYHISQVEGSKTR